MKILHILDTSFYGLGGAESVVREQIKISRQNGYEVALLQFGNHSIKKTSSLGIDIFTHNPAKYLNSEWRSENPNRISNFLQIFLGFYNPLGESTFKGLIKKIRPDLIHFNCIISPGYLRPLSELNIPLVVNFPLYIFKCPKGGLVHRTGKICTSPPFYCSIRNSLLSPLFIKPDIIIAQSRYCEQLLIEAGFLENNVRLVYNPVDIPVSIKEKKGWSFTLVFAGRLTTTKGVLEAINAVESYKGYPLKLIICGDGPLREEVIRRAEANPTKITYLNRLDHQELYKVYSNADAVIVPSRSPESFCLSAVEALSNGLPVLGTKLGALSELVIDGVTGYSLTPGEKDTIIEAIVRLYDNWDNYIQMVNNCRQLSAKFGINQHSENLINIYRELLNKNG